MKKVLIIGCPGTGKSAFGRPPLPVRLKEADTVFFLDYPIEVCMQGAIDRLGKPRPDVPWDGSQDLELNEEFCQWILDYPKDQLPVMRELLSAYSGRLYTFHNREETNSYLHNLDI